MTDDGGFKPPRPPRDEPAPSYSTRDLINFLDAFTMHNNHNSRPEMRWLVEQLKLTRDLVASVHSGQLPAEMKTQLNAFLAAEMDETIRQEETKLARLKRERDELLKPKASK